jgi:hypothetical protein
LGGVRHQANGRERTYMSTSDSMDSMGSMGSGFIPPTPGYETNYDHEMGREEEIGQTEAVMVSVR